MKTAKVPKFDWSRLDEPNGGHTKNEWGEIKESTPTIIPLYRVKWENLE